MSPKTVHPFLSAVQIAELNRKLGKQICSDYKSLLGPDEHVLIVITLKGALQFGADLVRELTIPIHIDFVRAASYGSGTKSSGKIELLKDLEVSTKGLHVLVLDEIVDSGRTLEFLSKKFQTQNPKSLRVCALLNKASRREVEVKVDYVGMEVEDKFLIGYGLDFDEKYRNLPDIAYLE